MRRQQIRADSWYDLESDGAFDGIVAPGCECSIDGSSLAIVFDASHMWRRRNSSTVLFSIFPSFMAIRKRSPMFDSTALRVEFTVWKKAAHPRI